eukprot:jgi/Bigna1/85198/estExt_fgenesh1_pg.C_20409
MVNLTAVYAPMEPAAQQGHLPAHTVLQVLIVLRQVWEDYVTKVITPVTVLQFAASALQEHISRIMGQTGVFLRNQACDVGTYQGASGATQCIGCSDGFYAPQQGMSACAECPDGYACTASVATACGQGSVPASNKTSCIKCEPGTFQPTVGLGQTCTACPDGYFTENSGSTVCEICPAGYSCTTSSKTQCLKGFFSSGAQTACTKCPTGTYTPTAGASACIACPPGKKCPDASATPESCPQGYYSTGNAYRNCTICPAGTLSNGDRSGCIECDAGKQCLDPTLGGVACTTGYYSLPGKNVACTPCPAGHSCAVNAKPVICPRGSYSAEGNGSCSPCPAGSSCLNPAQSPIACATGSYSTAGDHQCHICPAGSQCSNQGINPVQCTTGYSLSGAISCTMCPAGFSCRHHGEEPAKCHSGTYSLAGNDTCTTCPAGHMCPQTTETPLSCSPGTYATAGSVSCVGCPPGFYCPNVASFPLPCQSGNYSAANAAACTICPAGYRCPRTDSTTIFACQAGSYSMKGEVHCTPCPAGKYCPNTDGTGQQTCLAGTYCTGGCENTCQACPAGYACPNVDGSQNSKCPIGSYSTGNATVCTECPPGYSCPSSDSDVKYTCPEGTMSGLGERDCYQCPPGFACPDLGSSDNMYPCAAGSFSIGNQTKCTPCPAGYACPYTQVSTMTTCVEGQYSIGNQSTCTLCPAGSKCPTTIAEPIKCLPGTYALSGSRECSFCPAGYQCPISGLSPTICPQGSYSFGNTTNCTTCDPGYICAKGSIEPRPDAGVCPPGYYCPDSTTAIKCQRGTYSNVSGATAQSACTNCSAGYYCPEQATPSMQSAMRCRSGYYCPEGTQDYRSYPCPSGTYNTEIGATASHFCLSCPVGTYCPSGTKIKGYPCPAGYYCPAGTNGICLVSQSGCSAQATQPCPAGTYSGYREGLHHAGQCHPCPKGHYCEAGSVNPEPCAEGTFNPYYNVTSISGCQDCPMGFACPQVGTIIATVNCSAGYYCPSGTVYPDDYPCPAGKRSTKLGLKRIEECEPCPQGFVCMFGTGGETNKVQNCPEGYYCPEGTMSLQQYPCPAGTWSNISNLINSQQCDVCPRGYYCPGLGGTEPLPCAAGHYCPEGSVRNDSFPCPVGFYSNATNPGIWRLEQCQPCPVGYYCGLAEANPLPCMPGSYSDNKLMHTLVGPSPSGWPACRSCPAGYHCPNFAMTQPIACGKGMYSPMDSSSCIHCAAGHYCMHNATSETVMLMSPCPKGRFCDVATQREPSLDLYQCPPGYYCPQATPTLIACDPGTYRPQFGGEKSADCWPCPAGKYCAGPNATAPTGDCQPGYYCPPGSSSQQQNACPIGKYRKFPGATSLDSCAVCPPGYVCSTSALVTPVVCPRGSYCSGSSVVPCPIGTFGNTTGLQFVDECTDCSPGYYCETTGLTAPTGICKEGFVCRTGSNSSSPLGDPSNDKDNSKCALGGYCPEGSSIPKACPKGTFLNFTGAVNASQCFPCTAGYYCAVGNLGAPTGVCRAGYYCAGGAFTPTQYISEPGYWTDSGAWTMTPCQAGKYQPEKGSTSCLQCPKGFYCNDTAMTIGRNCPTGHYCGYGTITPTPCQEGTFSSSLNLFNLSQCTQCSPGKYCYSKGLSEPTGFCHAGYYCKAGARIPDPIDLSTQGGGLCPTGHFCVNGTHTPAECPTGTYQPNLGATNQTWCLSCPPGKFCNGTGLSIWSGDCAPGYYCIEGATTDRPTYPPTGGVCPPGNYCPSGSNQPLGCSEGTYAGVPGHANCTICPAQYYCPWNTSLPIDCPTGRYCPEGTNTSIPSCPIGTYNNRTQLKAETECFQCSPGHYCMTTGLSTPTGPCSAGYLCSSGAATPQGSQDIFNNIPVFCPAGQYCPTASAVGIPCPNGTYLTDTGKGAVTDCVKCERGSYCGSTGLTEPTGVCEAGYYCNRGASTPTPPGDDTGGLCPQGHYCLKNTSDPTPCPAGSYANRTGHVVCDVCPSGFFCEQGSDTYVHQICPRGYFCPDGSINPGTQHPCPNGTYGLTGGLKNVLQCTDCPGGKYCEGVSQINFGGDCDAGYYCLGKSSSRTPTALNGNANNGGICPKGSYCPLGSTNPTPCDGGRYCLIDGLTTFTGSCTEGFYCQSGAMLPNDTVCPPGHYCVAQSTLPARCPNGTFSNAEGNVKVSDCTHCTMGSYCNGTGLTEPTAKCTAGFYCPTGTEVPSLKCPIGNYCPSGSSAPVPCAAGTYQDEVGTGTCKPTPDGQYSNGTGNTDYEICPVGHICPAGTQYGNQYPCPNGTYGAATGRWLLSHCTSCTPGKYCGTSGLSNYTGDCSAGYFCTSGAGKPTPTDGITGNICPVGKYCPRGSIVPVVCPAGKFAMNEGNDAPEDCLDCPAGQYCAGIGSGGVDVNITCNSGYICTGGSTTPTPLNGIGGHKCPEVTYCPEGTIYVFNCPPGTYNGEMGQEKCKGCPAGYYCKGSPEPHYMNLTHITGSTGNQNFTDCPAGHYCPGNTSIPQPCPSGTYSTSTKLDSVSECTPCDKGKYCAGAALPAPSGNCAGGYYCNGSAKVPNPNGTYPDNGPCPTGSYCPSGTLDPIQCPPGSFNSIIGQDEKADCTPCTAGMYCAISGLSAPSGLCSAGFWCPENSTQPASNETQCPTGSTCPPGSPAPVQCTAGTYQPARGKENCIPCPKGYYCVDGPSLPIPCPLYSYCPSNSSAPVLCPNGTTNYNSTKLESAAQCVACNSTKYCQGGKQVGECSAGYFCLSRQGTPTPDTWDDQKGGPCKPGHYCPQGTSYMHPCPFGTMNPNQGGKNLSDCEPCQGGRMCPVGASDGVPCNPGHYCKFNDEVPARACPIRTYNPNSGSDNISACLPCKAGYWCNQTALSDYSQYPCPAGHFCPEATTYPLACPPGSFRDATGAQSLSDCHACPGGTFCGSGAIAGQPCQPGTYCMPGANSSTPCPAGYYCPEKTAAPLPCNGSYYCPVGSAGPLPCPNGSYCPPTTSTYRSTYPLPCPLGYAHNDMATDRSTPETGCKICPAGSYRSSASDATCLPSPPGYVCLAGCASPTPQNISMHRGYPCPTGAYCPAGSTQPSYCGPGYYNSKTARTNSSACLPCPKDSYSANVGQAYCSPCGSSSDTEGEASTTCNCLASTRVYQLETGSCLCKPMYEYINTFGVLYEGDSLGECQPIAYDSCTTSQVRDGVTGKCIAASSCDTCACDECELDKDNGVCACANPENLCDETCQANAEKLTIRDGTISCYDPVSGTTSSMSLDAIDGWSGKMSCTGSDCNLVSIAATAAGHSAQYGATSGLGSTIGCPTATTTANTSSLAHRARNLHLMGFQSRVGYSNVELQNTPTSSPTASPTGYTSATICIQIGQALVWDLTESQADYPVYMKDSILNSNADFDYSSFNQLGSSIAANDTVKFFTFTFTSSGRYVFADASDTNKVTLVSVLESSQECPAATISTTTLVSLNQNGVQANSSLHTTPDLTIVAGVVAVFVVMLLVLGGYTHVKNQIEDAKFEVYEKEGDSQQEFQKLYQKLQEQRKFVKAQLSNRSQNFEAQVDRMVAETQQLKALLGVKMSIGSTIFLEAAERFVMGEVMAQKSYFDRQTNSNEKQLIETLNSLLDDVEQEKEKVKDEQKAPVPQLTQGNVNTIIRDDMTEIKTNAGKAVELMNRIKNMAAYERSRREKFKANKGIIGDQLFIMLTKHRLDEVNAEDEYLDTIQFFLQLLENRMDQFVADQANFADTLRNALESHNEQSMVGTLDRHRNTRKKLCNFLEKVIKKFLDKHDRPHHRITNVRNMVREANQAAQNQAIRNIEAERQDQEAGLFRGLEPELANMIKVFLKEMCGEMRQIKIPGHGTIDMGGATGVAGEVVAGQVTPAGDIKSSTVDNEANAIANIAKQQADLDEEKNKALLEQMESDGANADDLKEAQQKLKQRGEMLKGMLDGYKNKLTAEQEEAMSAEDRERLAASREELEAKKKKHRAERLRLEKEMEEQEQKQLEEERRRQEEEAVKLEREKRLLRSKMNQQGGEHDNLREHEMLLDGMSNILDKSAEKRRQRFAAMKARMKNKKEESLRRLKAKQAAALRAKQQEIEGTENKEEADILKKELEEEKARLEQELQRAKIALEQEEEQRLRREKETLEKIRREADAAAKAARLAAEEQGSQSVEEERKRAAALEAELKKAQAMIEEMKARAEEAADTLDGVEQGFEDGDPEELQAEKEKAEAELRKAREQAANVKKEMENKSSAQRDDPIRGVKQVMKELKEALSKADKEREELRNALREARIRQMDRLKASGVSGEEIKQQEAKTLQHDTAILETFEAGVAAKKNLLAGIVSELDSLQGGMTDEDGVIKEISKDISKIIEDTESNLSEIMNGIKKRNGERQETSDLSVKKELSILNSYDESYANKLEFELSKLQKQRRVVEQINGKIDSNAINAALVDKKYHKKYFESLDEANVALVDILKQKQFDSPELETRIHDDYHVREIGANEILVKLGEVKGAGDANGYDHELTEEKAKAVGAVMLESVEKVRRKNKDNLTAISKKVSVEEKEMRAKLNAECGKKIEELTSKYNEAVNSNGADSKEATAANDELQKAKQDKELKLRSIPTDMAARLEEEMKIELTHQKEDLKRFHKLNATYAGMLGNLGDVVMNALNAIIESDLDVASAQLGMYERTADARERARAQYEADKKMLQEKAERQGKSDAQKEKELAELKRKMQQGLNQEIKSELKDSQKEVEQLKKEQQELLEKQKKLIAADKKELVDSAMADYEKRLNAVNKRMQNEKGAAKSKMERLRAMARKRRQKHLEKLKERQELETENTQAEINEIKAKAEKEVAKQKLDIPGMELVYLLNKFLDDSRLGLPQNLDEPFVPREYKAQLTENARLNEQMRVQHSNEQAELSKKLSMEISTAIDESSAEIEMQHEQDILQKRKDLLKSELDKNEQSLELDKFQRELDAQRERKLARIRERREADKRSQLRQLTHQQKGQVDSESKLQRKSLDKIIVDKIKAEEKKVLRAHLTERNRKTAKRTIQKVMHPRHGRELKDQHIDHFQELAVEISNVLDAEMQRVENEKQGIYDEVEMGSLEPIDAEQMVKELEESIDEEEIKLKAEEKLRNQHDQAVTDLRRDHFEEVKMYFKLHYPDEDFSATMWKLPFVDMNEVMRKMELEKEQRRRKAEEELKEIEAKIEAEKAKKQAQLKEEMDKYNSELKKWESKFQDKFNAAVQESIKKQDVELAEFKKDVENNAELSQEDREAQINAYMAKADNDRRKLTQQIENKKKQLQAKLRARMEEQRKKKAKEREAQINQQIERQRQEQMHKLQEERREKEKREADLKQKAVEKFVNLGLRAAFRRRGVEKACKNMLLVVGVEMKTEDEKKAEAKFMEDARKQGKEIENKLREKAAKASAEAARKGDLGAPFLSKLESMEKVMLNLLKHQGVKTPQGLGAAKKVYVDTIESGFKCAGSKPVQIPESKLNGVEQLALQFGRRIVDVLSRDTLLERPRRAAKLDGKSKSNSNSVLEQVAIAASSLSRGGSLVKALPVSLAIAKTIPTKPPGFPKHENAFYNSFHYDPDSRTIYIRAERARTVGEFAMVLIHTMAHIRSGTWADTDVSFYSEFYRALQQLCTHLFFQTAEKDSSADSLVDSKLPGTSADPFFSKAQMHHRMRNYLNFLHSAKLRTHLRKLEERVSKAANSKIRSRVKGGMATSEGAAAAAEGEIKDLETRITSYEEEGDKLNEQLIGVVDKMRTVSNDYIAGLEKSKTVVTEADVTRLHRLQDSLSRLDQEKSALLKRIAATETWTSDLRSQLLKKQRGE